MKSLTRAFCVFSGLLSFGSMLYLEGLARIMREATIYGSLIITPDRLFPYEMLFVYGLACFNCMMFCVWSYGALKK